MVVVRARRPLRGHLLEAFPAAIDCLLADFASLPRTCDSPPATTAGSVTPT